MTVGNGSQTSVAETPSDEGLIGVEAPWHSTVFEPMPERTGGVVSTTFTVNEAIASSVAPCRTFASTVDVPIGKRPDTLNVPAVAGTDSRVTPWVASRTTRVDVGGGVPVNSTAKVTVAPEGPWHSLVIGVGPSISKQAER